MSEALLRDGLGDAGFPKERLEGLQPLPHPGDARGPLEGWSAALRHASSSVSRFPKSAVER
jgi:hypothetical protein